MRAIGPSYYGCADAELGGMMRYQHADARVKAIMKFDVMSCELTDGRVKKCEPYFPVLESQVMFGTDGDFTIFRVWNRGQMIRFVRMGENIKNCVLQFPVLKLEAQIFPITKTILRVALEMTPEFKWNDRVHGIFEPFFIWVEDAENTEILYSETIMIHKKQQKQTQKLGFTIPIMQSTTNDDGLPSQIFIRAISDRWIGSETIIPVSFKHLILPEQTRAPHTNLLNLRPLPINALQNPVLEAICASRFEYFNPVQTQVFHTMYHTRENVLLGAPTGSGKTLVAELAMWASFRDFPKSKVVYIAPLKALVRERVKDWKHRLMPLMGRSLVELTGDVTPDLRMIEKAGVIIVAFA